MARTTADGNEVVVLILGEGCTSRSTTVGGDMASSLARLRSEAATANTRVGVRDLRFGGLPDNRFDSVPLLEVVKLVEEVVEQFGPDTVLSHHGGDLNIDHRITAAAVLTATRPVPGCPIHEVLAFEIRSSTEWAFGQGGTFSPSYYVDISDHLTQKLNALAAYESEIRDFPHPRSIEGVEVLARLRGSEVGCAAAEGLVPVRVVKPRHASSSGFPYSPVPPP